MTRKNEERLIKTLELIDNDLETIALTISAMLPPLILGPDALPYAKRVEQVETIAGLAEAHGKRALAIRTELQETLKHV